MDNARISAGASLRTEIGRREDYRWRCCSSGREWVVETKGWLFVQRKDWHKSYLVERANPRFLTIRTSVIKSPVSSSVKVLYLPTLREYLLYVLYHSLPLTPMAYVWCPMTWARQGLIIIIIDRPTSPTAFVGSWSSSSFSVSSTRRWTIPQSSLRFRLRAHNYAD